MLLQKKQILDFIWQALPLTETEEYGTPFPPKVEIYFHGDRSRLSYEGSSFYDLRRDFHDKRLKSS